jgi:hypothetical protein
MKEQLMNLNIRYDLPAEVWAKIPEIYATMDGWIGFKDGFPYWFSDEMDEKHITASVEPSGLQFIGLMEEEEWENWKLKIKLKASEKLGFKVGEIELGEVDE